MTQRFDQADVTIRVTYPPTLFDAMRAHDPEAIREETQLLIRNTFMRASASLTRAAACRGTKLCEPFAVAILGVDGLPFDTKNKTFDVADQDLLFMVVTDVKNQRVCARIEFDAPRKVQ